MSTPRSKTRSPSDEDEETLDFDEDETTPDVDEDATPLSDETTPPSDEKKAKRSRTPAKAAKVLDPPLDFPTSGFYVIDPASKVEEETLPSYQPSHFYPMRIGEVVGKQFQVVAKLGYDATSTLWLARDLKDETFWMLKVLINTIKTKQDQEGAVYRYLAKVGRRVSDDAKDLLGTLHKSFKVQGPNGYHQVFVTAPAVTLAAVQEARPNSVFERDFAARSLDQLLFALIYLHEEVVVVHGGELCRNEFLQ